MTVPNLAVWTIKLARSEGRKDGCLITSLLPATVTTPRDAAAEQQTFVRSIGLRDIPASDKKLDTKTEVRANQRELHALAQAMGEQVRRESQHWSETVESFDGISLQTPSFSLSFAIAPPPAPSPQSLYSNLPPPLPWLRHPLTPPRLPPASTLPRFSSGPVLDVARRHASPNAGHAESNDADGDVHEAPPTPRTMPASYALIWITPRPSRSPLQLPRFRPPTATPRSCRPLQASCRRRPPSSPREYPPSPLLSAPPFAAAGAPTVSAPPPPAGIIRTPVASAAPVAHPGFAIATAPMDITRQAGAIMKVVLPDYDLSGVFARAFRCPDPNVIACAFQTEAQAAWFVTAFNASRVQPYENLWVSLN
ncbi:hypothetical protein DFH09DRAFT_1377452 [Mycena vulgaris]|nr:hypothetical protein DFH09DRAFT_1377452 [Mycena vulgaris]